MLTEFPWSILYFVTLIHLILWKQYSGFTWNFKLNAKNASLQMWQRDFYKSATNIKQQVFETSIEETQFLFCIYFLFLVWVMFAERRQRVVTPRGVTTLIMRQTLYCHFTAAYWTRLTFFQTAYKDNLCWLEL